MNPRKRKKGNKQDRHDNSAWGPRGGGKKKPASTGAILHARCDNESEEGFKSSFQVNLDAIELALPLTASELAANIDEHLKEGSFRPLKTVVHDESGSPLYGKTPGNTTLYKDGKYHSLYTFSNRERAKIQYEESDQCRQINEFASVLKAQRLEITESHQKRVLRERSKAGFKRTKQQKQVMGESANDHMQKLSVTIENVKFEWAHLLAHAIVGAAGQDADNLVATTDHANTKMIFAEADIDMLSKKYPDGFTLEVTATVLKDTHAATKIEYKVMTPDFQNTYLFDGQDKQQPHISDKNYFHAVTKALIPGSDPSPGKDADDVIAKRTRAKAPKVSQNNIFSKAEKKKRARSENIEPVTPIGKKVK